MAHDTTSSTDTARRPEPPERLVGMAEICARTGWDRSTVRRNAEKGQFPPLRRKGDRQVFITESEFVRWMRS